MTGDRTLTIVGGGVHGVHLAVRLLAAGHVDRDELEILEPNGLLGGFRRACRQCGMAELRSPYVHHVDDDPFSLRDFARRRGRVDELRPNSVGAERPTVDLFFDHADWVCDRETLAELVTAARLTGLRETGEDVVLETTAGPVRTHACVLAIGHGGALTMPDWTADVPAEAAVTHVWDDFDPAGVDDHAHVGIVGGGITAAQLATTLARPGREVTLLARSPFCVETLEASTDWMHFGQVIDRLHDLPPASAEREELVQTARYDGTIPPHVFRPLRRAIEDGRVDLAETEVVEVTPAGPSVVVTCADGRAVCFDELVCATGFDSPYEAPLLEQVASETDLATGAGGAPVLSDETLRWRRTDGSVSPVAVTGAAAQQVLGPFGRNVVGARKAAKLILSGLQVPATPGGTAQPQTAPSD